MTPDDFIDRAEAAALPAGSEPKIDPLTVIVVVAALTAAVEYIVTHCLDWLTEHIARSPNAAQRGVLRLWVVGPAVRRAAKDHPGLDRRQIEDRVMAGLLAAGQSLTTEEFNSLKGHAA